MRTIKEALEDGSISLEDEIDYPDMTEEEYKEEIERLKKDKEIDVKLNLELLDAVGKLNNILNELEKWIDDRQNSSVFYEEYEKVDIYGIVLDKIKELRGDKE